MIVVDKEDFEIKEMIKDLQPRQKRSRKEGNEKRKEKSKKKN